MNRTKILGTVLAVGVMIFMFAPIASAQQYAGILHDQWFKAKLGLKVYKIADDHETVLGKGTGTMSAYLHFAYNSGLDPSYTITTCMQDDLDDNIWHKNASDPIPIDRIYGATHPEVWLLSTQIFLIFQNGISDYAILPIFYTKITADKANPATLKNATISNVECMFEASIPDADFGYGSCSLSGPLIPAAKVATKVPAACRP
jgi:hypothetical protein